MFASIDTVEEAPESVIQPALAQARRMQADRVLRLVALAPTGILVTHILQADRILGGPLVKLPPEGIVALIREMLENGYLEYVSGTTRLTVTSTYRHYALAA